MIGLPTNSHLSMGDRRSPSSLCHLKRRPLRAMSQRYSTSSNPYQEDRTSMTCLPFGLTNTPNTFKGLMNHILRSLIGLCMARLVYSVCVDDHVKHIRLVLQLLKNKSLYMNLESACSALKKWDIEIVQFGGL
ncbi:Retrovirus-related Pol polyprotein, partial [Mucuna pruriens]